ncbi:Helicase associated domain protein [Paracoccaceae bacterium]|nr:Helicase associated domain protein [Paracoccaceae bacterium]
MASFDQFITSLRQEFGEQDAGKKFEVFCKWFLENDPQWSKEIGKVWLWDEYPNKWQRQDLGTDLVFRDNEGLIWAVQAKCYSEHRSTTKGDMNSFLADTGRREVDRRLWLQTTNKIEAKAEKTLKGQDKSVTIFNLNDFRSAQIDYPGSFAELYEAKVKDKPKPDTHQIEAIDAVQTKLQSLDRGQMIMACGTGKTFTTLWIKEALEAQTTLVLLPSLSLLSQTMREWAWAGNSDFEILNVCSDKSVGKKTEDMKPSDAPFPVTSEVLEIAKFLKKSGPRVLFCTYQSSELIAEAQLNPAVPTFDLAVADEAHRCAGKADAGFATILDGDKIRADKRLFTTATPRYFGKAIKDAAKAKDLAVVGMDNEEVFGPVVHKLSFGEAIQRELLTDYQVVIVGVDEPMVKQWIDDYEIVATNPDEHTDARTLAAKIGLIKAIKDYDLKRVISFHSRVKGAEAFSKELIDVVNLIEPDNRPEGTFLADYVSGEMKAGDRKEKIDKLKVLEGYDRGILTNARCLAEGVDVPTLDGVAFIDPRGSQVEIIQAVGRAIRKVRGAKVQTKGTIVIPVFIEDGDDPEASIEASNFKPVWDVLKALRAHDDGLANQLDQYRTDMAKKASQNREKISDKVIFDIPSSVDVEFSNALRTVLVEATTASWEFWFGLLEIFYERVGHCSVPGLYSEGKFKLGAWVSAQRRSGPLMSIERLKRLNAVDFVWDQNKADWEKAFGILEKFYRQEGHANVPLRKKESGFSLGSWVVKQRTIKEQLSESQIKKLELLKFNWDPRATQWQTEINYLRIFYAREQHANVPRSHFEGQFDLGQWVYNRRNNKEALSSEQINELNLLNFSWESVLDSKWNAAFEKLEEFYRREKHTNVPFRKKESGFPLGTWVSNLRKRQKDLNSEQIEKLTKLDFLWTPRSAQWDTGYNHLQVYFDSFGNCNVPKNYKVGSFNLAEWVVTQRKNKDEMSRERHAKLDNLNFVWNTNDAYWDQGYLNLKSFFEENGHSIVPVNFKTDEFGLGRWVVSQRNNKSSLSSDRTEKLVALKFVWNVLDFKWDRAYGFLEEFYRRNRHSKVPKNYRVEDLNLYEWIKSQRRHEKSLSPERYDKLNALGFIWNTHEDRT